MQSHANSDVMKLTPNTLFSFLVPTLLTSTLCITLLLSQMVLSDIETSPLQTKKQQPNIIFILLDDLGWRDVGFMGNTFIETPNLDRLASEGAIFNQAYSSAPNCAPSRAAIMTGLYAPRTEVYTMLNGDMGQANLRPVLTPHNKMYLESHFTTVAEVLKANGYATAHIGKWNLGSGKMRGPLGQGFDKNIAGYRGGTPPNGYFAPYDLPGLDNAPDGEYLTERLSQEAVNFIQQAVSDKTVNQPFFIYLSHFSPHHPIEAPEVLEKKYAEKLKQEEFRNSDNSPVYAGMLDSVDRGVGKIMKALKQYEVDDNTLIVFTADNGGYAQLSGASELQGGKSSLYEGGIRVPLLFWWPSKIPTAVLEEPVIGVDFFPTLLAASGFNGTDLPDSDGENLLPVLDQSQSNLNREDLFWYFPAYTVEGASEKVFEQRPAVAIRRGDWKLIRSLEPQGKIELYQLRNDPAERHNLAKQQPQQVQALNDALSQWLLRMDAPLPLKPNLEYRQGNAGSVEITAVNILDKIKSFFSR